MSDWADEDEDMEPVDWRDVRTGLAVAALVAVVFIGVVGLAAVLG